MAKNLLLEYSKELATKCELLCKSISGNSNTVFQLRKSSSSVFANITEAQYPQSKALPICFLNSRSHGKSVRKRSPGSLCSIIQMLSMKKHLKAIAIFAVEYKECSPHRVLRLKRKLITNNFQKFILPFDFLSVSWCKTRPKGSFFLTNFFRYAIMYLWIGDGTHNKKTTFTISKSIQRGRHPSNKISELVERIVVNH